jgi:hypothetical protein
MNGSLLFNALYQLQQLLGMELYERVIAFYEFQRTAEAALMEYFLALAWIG